ncbi:MAG: tRNA uridine-5-carboxymethylaminomethyl(34) synthesis GTPase MnmE [Hydrogenophaga sp.]|uniref:tRNA uridine-5-carboxymethylaminomethyl(34) synthesis GTPase MnmE n=1 Tax=Hydrogenophaga sp. TaxID=1904254 RepID=UPI002ABCCE3F|nr:tRNA uridine-5-carboxymethylaminomethyl(34) synthesis GTPase MnmE [Hydrogenophaga sp.]MDZ4103183.1 tRNA uridine-5-carboxymethylaminomethyl(34) synthesis GTPase MnmE [Hydrogenophaga sp.]
MLAASRDPIVAIATAPGRGGVGIVRVSGRGLAPFVQVMLGRALTPREATYLPFADAAGQPIDHGLAVWFAGPHSYTGEDVLELQGHGGPVVLQLLVARCLEVGRAVLPALRVARAGEFTERAFLNDKLDLAQAEAVADLIDASTEAAARSASRSLAGVFSGRVHGLRDALVSLRMLVEATLDFPEEDIDFLQKADATGQLRRLREALSGVQAQARQGALLRDGFQVVIAGQPNAGKSSLLNALAGAELAIVTPVAGTTRDVVQQTIQIEGVPLHVVDTAGLRDSPDVDEVEKIGIERAWGRIREADVVLFLHDLTRTDMASYQNADAAIATSLARAVPAAVPVLHVWNKLDQSPSPSADLQGGVAISAKRGEGLEALRQRLLTLAGWQQPGDGLFMARARHLQALQRVDEHLLQADGLLAAQAEHLDLLAEELRLAQQALGAITGEFTADDLLGEIFSRFCIGK